MNLKKGDLKRNKLVWIGLVVVFVIVFYALTDPDATPKGKFEVIIDGNEVQFTDYMGRPWLSEQNRTMVPVRIISENMGYDVDWEQESTTVVINGNNTEVRLKVGENTAMKNGQKIYIDTQNGKPVDTKSVNINDRVYVPIRFVTEVMGGEVDYDRVELYGMVTHKITITTGQATPVPTPGTDPTFDPVVDVMPDGRLTKEKTTEYIEKMIEGTTLKKENGKYILEFERPAVAEGFETGIGFDALTHSGDGGYALSSSFAILPHNKLPGNQSFVKELDPERLKDVNFYKFTFGVFKPGSNTSTSYYIWYWPDTGRSEYLYTDEFGAQQEYNDFDKNRLFEGL